MVPIDRDEVARLMAQMAAGDPAGAFALIAAFGGRLAGVVRRQLFAFGRRDVASDPAEVDYLVQSAAFVLFDRAASWSPDGALPWTWAERAIRAEVVAYLGHPSVELDQERLDAGRLDTPAGSGPVRASGGGGPAVPSTGAPGSATSAREFESLAARFPTVALLDVAIDEVASERDRLIHLEYGIQKRSGDASPSHTVAAQFGLTPQNVRQIDRRVRRRLQALVDADPRFADLRTLGWLAA